MADHQLIARLGRLVLLAGATILAGCEVSQGLLDAPYPVNLHVAATADAVEVEAPEWYADRTDIFLCPSEPPFLPDPGPARQGWDPGPPCHGFGSFESANGLATTLALADLSAAERETFASAESWYLLLVDVAADDHAMAAARTRFGVPDGFTAS
jgi:hypothetical protein